MLRVSKKLGWKGKEPIENNKKGNCVGFDDIYIEVWESLADLGKLD